MERKFLGIPISTFVGGTRAAVDIYVKLSDDHFVKIVAAGSAFDVQRLGEYQNREISNVYVRKEDFGAFAQESTKIADIVASSTAGVHQKMSILLRTTEHVFAEIAENGINHASYHHALQVSQSTLKVVQSQPSLSDLLDELSKYNVDFVRHSVATSVLSTMLVQALNWHGKKTASMASLGGLLHDIGMRELPAPLHFKLRSEMSPEEIELFESHPMRGFLLLKDLPFVPAEILQIVAEHHELPSGAGFPRRLRGDKIFPLSRAVAFADNLADLIIRTQRNPHPKELKDALLFMHHTMRHDFSEIYFDAAHRLEKADLAYRNAA